MPVGIAARFFRAGRNLLALYRTQWWDTRKISTVQVTRGAIIAVPDHAQTVTTTPVNIVVLDNDVGDLLTVTAVSTPDNGTTTLEVDDSITYEADALFEGEDTFTYTLEDAAGVERECAVTVEVLPSSGTPSVYAVRDSGATQINTAATIPVLDNDLGTGLTLLSVGDVSASTRVLELATVISIAADDATVPEGDVGNSSVTFTVNRLGNTAEASTVDWVKSGTTAPSDFATGQLFEDTLTFASSETEKTIEFLLAGDTNVGPDETIIVTLSNVVGATLGTAVATTTVIDDDAGPTPDPTLDITASPTTVAEGNSGTQTITFTVTRAGDLTGASTVVWVKSGTTNADDFASGTLPLGALSFAAGETTKTIPFVLKGDTDVEAGETIIVTLSAPTGATLDTAAATVTVTNDDTVTGPTQLAISAGTASVIEGNSGTQTITFTVGRSGTLTGTSTVNWVKSGTTNADDFSPGTDFDDTLTFTPSQTTKTITFPLAGDATVESGETIIVTLSNPTGATITTASATTTVVDDDDTSARWTLPRTVAQARARYTGTEYFVTPGGGNVLSTNPAAGGSIIYALRNAPDLSIITMRPSATSYGTVVVNNPAQTGKILLRAQTPAFTSIDTTVSPAVVTGAVTGASASRVTYLELEGFRDPMVEGILVAGSASAPWSPITSGSGLKLRNCTGETWVTRCRTIKTPKRGINLEGSTTPVAFENWTFNDKLAHNSGVKDRAGWHTDYGIFFWPGTAGYCAKNFIEGAYNQPIAVKEDWDLIRIEGNSFHLWASDTYPQDYNGKNAAENRGETQYGTYGIVLGQTMDGTTDGDETIGPAFVQNNVYSAQRAGFVNHWNCQRSTIKGNRIERCGYVLMVNTGSAAQGERRMLGPRVPEDVEFSGNTITFGSPLIEIGKTFSQPMEVRIFNNSVSGATGRIEYITRDTNELPSTGAPAGRWTKDRPLITRGTNSGFNAPTGNP